MDWSSKLPALFMLMFYSCVCTLVYFVYFCYLEWLTVSTTEPKHNYHAQNEARNDEWEQLNRDVFFRRSAAFYVVNRSLLRLFMLKRHGSTDFLSLEVRLLVHYKERTYALAYSDSLSLNHWDHRDHYEFFTLERADFDLLAELGAQHNLTFLSTSAAYRDLRVQAFVTDTASNNRTRAPLDLHIKQWNSSSSSSSNSSKQGSIICSDCLFYGSGNERARYEQLRWWLEINRAFGYDKIVLCNTSLPNTRAYRQLFAAHAGFVELYTLQHLPDFMTPPSRGGNSTDTTHAYLSRFEQLQLDNAYTPEIEIFQIVHFNECLMRHSDAYRHVAVHDTDELIVPRDSTDHYAFVSELRLSDVSDRRSLLKRLDALQRATCNASDINRHIERLEKRTNTNNVATTFKLKMGHHLNRESTRVLLHGLERYLASKEFRAATKSKHKHAIEISDRSEYGSFAYRVHLEDARDVTYAQNLLKIHALLVGGGDDDQLSTRGADEFNHFDRFVFVSGTLTSALYGKSVHHTDATATADVHQPILLYEDAAASVTPDKEDAHVSHFRKRINFYEARDMSVRDLHFDFNYMFCFYRRALRKLSSSLDIYSSD